MTDASTSPSGPAARESETIEVDLRDPRLAAFLAWLIPGAGHFYQGRTAKAILFFVCIMGTWLFGMYIGQSRVVFFQLARPWGESRWAFFCQVGVGLPSMPAFIQGLHARRNPNADPLWNGFMAPPRPPGFNGGNDRGDLHKWQAEGHKYFELGTVYTMVAGLLNVLAIYDAFGGPLLILAGKKKSDDEAESEKQVLGGPLPNNPLPNKEKQDRRGSRESESSDAAAGAVA